MEDSDDLVAPKLRLLRRRIPKASESATAYDVTSLGPNRPRARNAPLVQPEWNADAEVAASDGVDTFATRPPLLLPPRENAAAARPRQPRARKPPPVLPEWNSDVEVTRIEDEPHSRQQSASQQSTPVRTEPSMTNRVPSASSATANLLRNGSLPGSDSPSSATGLPRYATKGAKGAGRGNQCLEDAASLIDSVPIKWPPSRHHVAELLAGVGCMTVGDFRLFLKNTPIVKVVDAMLTADASCSSPGCIRGRQEAQKCIEDFAQLVRNDVQQRSVPQPAAKAAAPASRGVAALTNPEFAAPVADIASVGEGAAGNSGCPGCGRNIVGRALVMHLKTCRPSASQPKMADPFVSDSQPGRLASPPLPTNSNTRPVSPPVSMRALAQPSERKGELATDAERRSPSIPQAGAGKAGQHAGDAIGNRSVRSQDLVPSGEGAGMVGMELDAGAEEEQLPCPHCQRTFRKSVLKRHVSKCLQINQERKQFNAKAHALPAEARKLHKQAERAEKAEAKKAAKVDRNDVIKPAAQMPSWKAKSEAFRAAIQNARVVDQCIKEGKPLSQLPPSVPTAPELDDRIQCQHCGRRFGQQQAERHIPICPKGRGKGRR